MKIKKNRLKEIIQEEITDFNGQGEGLKNEEIPIASVIYMLMGKALDYIHEYRGEMPDHEEVSGDFEKMHEQLAKYWKMLDEHEDLAGGETPQDLLRPVHENLEEDNTDE